MAYELTKEKLEKLTIVALKDEEFLPYLKKYDITNKYISGEISKQLSPEISSITESLDRIQLYDLDNLQKKIIEERGVREGDKSNNEVRKEVIENYENDVKLIVDKLDQFIIKAKIEPTIREFINKFELGGFEKNLVAKTARGLSEIPYSDYEIPTKAKNDLGRLLDSMNGGSIGIAGPRGVGKSTLIRSFCSTNLNLYSSNEDGNFNSKLAILISVPVKYDTRDFILQIFSSLCRQVLNYGHQPLDVNTDDRPFSESLPKVIFQKFLDKLPVWRGLLIITLLFSIVGVFVSIAWTRSLLYNEAISLLPTPTATITSTPLPPSSTPFPPSSTPTFVASPPVQALATAQPIAATIQPPAENSQDLAITPSFSDTLISLGIEPRFLFNLSILLLFTSGLAIYIYWLDSKSRNLLLHIQRSQLDEEKDLREKRNQLIRNLEQKQGSIQRAYQRDTSEENRRELDYLLYDKNNILRALEETEWMLRKVIYSQRETGKEIRGKSDLGRKVEIPQAREDDRSYFSENTRRLAEQYLKNIRFQQSFSSSSSGSVKLPIALEANIEYVTALSKIQMSLPEIVEEYKAFVSNLTNYRDCKVIIGIDELDKITNIDTARIFINEVKAIFGINNCFYLLSVSENAMSNFERRGLPFRDEFDSAFDRMLYLDYLDYQASRELLKRRVIGLPLKFMDFAYALSGGLPRDLIRTCRDIYDFASLRPDEVPFIDACKYIIQQDIKAKIRAMNIAAGEIDVPNSSSNLLSSISQLALVVNQINDIKLILADMVKPVYASMSKFEINGRKSISSEQVDFLRSEIAKTQIFHAVVNELISYIYFSITVFDFFVIGNWKGYSNYLDFISSDSGKDLTLLAKCKNAFAINPQHAFALVGEFRKMYGWDVLESDGWKSTTAPKEDVKEIKKEEVPSDDKRTVENPKKE